MRALLLAGCLLAACGQATTAPPATSSTSPTSPTLRAPTKANATPAAAAPPASQPASSILAPDRPLPPGALRRLGGTHFRHADTVNVLALSPDGRLVATGADDNSLRVWDAADGALLYAPPTYATLLKRISAAVFDARGQKLFIASGSDPIAVVATDTWAALGELTTCGKRWAVALALSPDDKTLAVACEEALWLQPVDSSKPTRVLGFTKPRLLSWSADGSLLAVGTYDSIEIVDPKTRVVTDKIRAAHMRPGVLAFAPTAPVLAYEDGMADEVRLYDAAMKQQKAAFKAHVGADAVAWSADGRTLAFAPSAGPVSIIAVDIATGARRELLAPYHNVRALAFAPNGALWVAQDHGARAWDVAADRELIGPAGHLGAINALAFRPDGEALASGSTDATIRVWDLASGASRVLEVHTDEWGVIVVNSDDDYKKFSLSQVMGLGFTPDGGGLISADGYIGQGILRVWSLSRAELARATALHDIGVRAFALAPDAKTAYVLGSEGGESLRWIDAATGKTQRELRTDNDSALALSGDGKRLAVSTDKNILVLDAGTGAQIAALDGYPRSGIALSRDGSTIAIGFGEVLQVFTVGAAKPHIEELFGESITRLAFASDGRTLVTGGYRGAVSVVDLSRPAEARHFKGHRGKIRALAIAPDQATFASSGDDGQIFLWPMKP